MGDLDRGALALRLTAQLAPHEDDSPDQICHSQADGEKDHQRDDYSGVGHPLLLQPHVRVTAQPTPL